MKFIVTRTSSYGEEDNLCNILDDPRLIWENLRYVDRRYYNKYFGDYKGEPWYEKFMSSGRDHQIINDPEEQNLEFVRHLIHKKAVIEINSLEELIAICRDKIVIDYEESFGLPILEIYDIYRE